MTGASVMVEKHRPRLIAAETRQRHGEMSGGLAVISDVPKTLAYSLGTR